MIELKTKQFLNWFNHSTEEEKTTALGKETEEEVLVNEGHIDAWKFGVKFLEMANTMWLEMRSCDSNLIPKQRVLISDFCELLLDNATASVRHFCKSLRTFDLIRLVFLLFKNVFRFVFVRKNFKRVNRALYRVIKRRPSR